MMVVLVVQTESVMADEGDVDEKERGRKKKKEREL